MAKDYISVTRGVFNKFWGKHNAALTFYMALSSLVTVEIPDPENPGHKLGIVLGGTKLKDKELSDRLGQPERLVRNGREELAEFGLIIKRQYPYDYKLAIRFSDKWSTKNRGKMGPQYKWILEAQEVDDPRPDDAEVAVQQQPLDVQPRPLRAEQRPLSVQPRPVDSEPLIAEDLRKGKSSLKSSQKVRERVKQEKSENPPPSTSLPLERDPTPTPRGQDKGASLARELVCIADDSRAIFNKKAQGRLSELLSEHSEEEIVARWTKHWASIREGKENYAVDWFLKSFTADRTDQAEMEIAAGD